MQIFETKAAEGLEKLNLTTALAQLDTTAQTASAENWSYTHFLGFLHGRRVDRAASAHR